MLEELLQTVQLPRGEDEATHDYDDRTVEDEPGAPGSRPRAGAKRRSDSDEDDADPGASPKRRRGPAGESSPVRDIYTSAELETGEDAPPSGGRGRGRVRGRGRGGGGRGRGRGSRGGGGGGLGDADQKNAEAEGGPQIDLGQFGPTYRGRRLPQQRASAARASLRIGVVPRRNMSEEDYETAEEKAERKRAEREERMPRDEEKKVPIEYHPDEEWLHHSALTEEEEAKMDPEGILKKLAEEFTRKREKFRVDPTFGFTSARGEYCYLCESHPFQPKDGENPYLKTINQIIDLYGKGKTLAWVCWKAEEYYQTHILKETRKIMRMQNFANHILEHNPSQSSLAQTQLSSLIRLSNAISKRVFPPDDEVPIDVKYVTVFHKNFEQIRKAKRFLDEAARK